MKFLLIVLSSLLATSSAMAVKVVGNGGDTYALEFVSVANEAYKYLKFTGVTEVNLTILSDAIKNTKVESTDKKLFLDKVPKDAINYPSEMRIIFNRTAWMNAKEGQKPILVMHEYFGIMGVNDSSYALSTSLLKGFGYKRLVTEVDGPFTVNFATKNQYELNAHVTLENYGLQSWHYNADDERIRLVVETKGQRKVFILPIKGRVISAVSGTDGEDDGVKIVILQRYKDKKGSPKRIQENGNQYFMHVIRDYRLQFHSPIQGEIPDDAEFEGPLSNMAG